MSGGKKEIFVSNLNLETGTAALYDFFTKLGIKTKEARIITTKVGDQVKSKGFGFVEVESEDDVIKALGCKDPVLDNNRLQVRRAKPKSNKIFIGNIPDEVSDISIKKWCKKISEGAFYRIMTRIDDGRKKRFCFVSFPPDSDVVQGIVSGKEIEIDGKILLPRYTSRRFSKVKENTRRKPGKKWKKNN